MRLVHAEYRHRPGPGAVMFASSRYAFDAALAATAELAAERQVWLTDVDCVWVDPAAVVAAAPPPGTIGCVHIGYPPDWNILGVTPRSLGALGTRLGATVERAPWVGGDLLAGAAADLRALVAACDEVEREATAIGALLATEEQLLTLTGQLGRVRFHDLGAVAGRVWTGPRHGAVNPPEPLALGLWHLPSEKGLSLRRAARDVLAGREERLARGLGSIERAARRFNVAGNRRARRVRDDGWIALNRVADAVRSRLRLS